jgi:hypothetical protein
MLKSLFLSNNPDGDFLAPFTVTIDQVLAECQLRWQSTFSTPEYYTFLKQLYPHPWMKLDKFTRGRVPQFTAHKSYLAAHQSWYNKRLSTHCPRCYAGEEDLQHKTFHCPLHTFAREDFILKLSSIDNIWEHPYIIY